MSQSEDAKRRPAAPPSERASKKPYIKPELRFEQVFETRSAAARCKLPSPDAIPTGRLLDLVF